MRKSRSGNLRALGIGLLAAALGGCASSSSEHIESLYVAPGKYVLYDCQQLATAAARFSAREQELARLMARAKEGPAGGLVSAMAYDSDYYSTLGELRDVQREQSEKKCDPNLKPEPPKPEAEPKAKQPRPKNLR